MTPNSSAFFGDFFVRKQKSYCPAGGSPGQRNQRKHGAGKANRMRLIRLGNPHQFGAVPNDEPPRLDANRILPLHGLELLIHALA